MRNLILEWLTDGKLSTDRPKKRYFIVPIFGDKYEVSKTRYYLEMLPFIIFQLCVTAIIIMFAIMMVGIIVSVIKSY